MMGKRRKLPIGIQTFAEMIEEGHYYVDKTPFADRLIDQGKYYFLSRPRRFGKSLFLDTLKELFEGHEALFRGLYIHDRWDWHKRRPVVMLSFGGAVLHSREALDRRIRFLLRNSRKALGIPETDAEDIVGDFQNLIRDAAQQYGERVVLLIDEYDKPILDNITQSDVALELRDGLRNLYSVIKECDAYLQFCLLTGVSKFSKVSLFSGLNNLNDITLDAEYSAICGYTDQEVDQVFAPELPDFDREQIRHWYNGYNWLGESVYNPFDVLLLFQKKQFRPYWFETATPTFLVKLLAERGFSTPKLASLLSGAQLLSRFDVDDIEPEALLFQCGYLTFHRAEQPLLGRWEYTLGYPNHEVRISLNEALLPAYGVPTQVADTTGRRVLSALRQQDFPALKVQFEALFASIPYHWQSNNPLAQYEGYYASVFYSYLAAIGLDLAPEDVSSMGRVDLRLALDGVIILIEFKVVPDVATGQALTQLRERDYAAKYRGTGQPLYLLGVEFSKATRQIVGFEWQVCVSNVSATRPWPLKK